MGAAGAKGEGKRQQLLQRAEGLCEAFAQRKSLEEVLSHFSEDVLCFEHGLPDLAPFLGREFRGLQGARDYFQLIAELLDFEVMDFSDYMVDVETDQVSVRGRAKFIWRSTGKSWQEVFVYRLRFDTHGKISAYEVWADSGAAHVSSMARKRVMLVSYEFTYSPFSGNGILARSIVKSLLRLGCHVTVWCCKPEATGQDNHLEEPEIPLEDQQRLTVIPFQLAAEHGWRQLDDNSAWQQFNLTNLQQPLRSQLLQEVSSADVLCAIDWTGARALKSVPDCLREKRFVYMNFRVYSCGVQEERRQWFDRMELQGFEGCDALVALSSPDRVKLMELGAKEVEVLLPPLRGDLQRLAQSPSDQALPPEVASRLGTGRCLVTCVVRLSQEKQALRFVRLIQKLGSSLKELGLVPLLAGAIGEESYAAQVKRELLEVDSEAIIISSFLTPKALSAIFARTALNVHPCAYDAYGMTVVEAAACGAPSVLNSGVGARALVQDASVTVDMPQEEQLVPEEMVTIVERALRDAPRLERLGAEAQSKALEWDELAYGRRLLGML